jgi:hypothetical protein
MWSMTRKEQLKYKDCRSLSQMTFVRLCNNIEEEQTTQWPKEKVEKDKQRSKKHTHKTKDRVTRTPLKTRVVSFGNCVVCSSLIYGF